MPRPTPGPAPTTPAARGSRSPLLVLALVAALLLAGCGGGGTKESGPTPTQVMATAKKKFDDARSVAVSLATTSVPSSGNGVLAATGTVTHAPAFTGDVKVVLSGLTATVPITSVGGKVYAKLPLQTKFSVIDPQEYGAPDPADFADPKTGLSALLTNLTKLEKGSKTRSGGSVLTSYSGTLPGAAVKKVIPSADASSTYPTKVGVDDTGYARTVSITGPFFSGGGDVTYKASFESYDKAVTVTAPTAG